jgi:TolB-like protein
MRPIRNSARVPLSRDILSRRGQSAAPGAATALYLLALVGLLALTTGSRAENVSGSFSETGIGARQLGLGGAFVAIADDAYAMGANPAGLALMDRISVTFDYANLFGLGLLKQSYFGGVFPTSFGVHGFSYQGLQVEFTPFPQKLTESTLQYSYARSLGPLSLGTSIKYLDLTSDFQQGTGTGLAFDVGARYQWTPRLAIGGSIRNLYASVKYGSGTTEDVPASWRLGAAYKLSDRWTASGEWGGVSGDFFNRFRAGTEYWIMRPEYLSRMMGAESQNRGSSIFNRPELIQYPLSIALRAGLEKQGTGQRRVIPAVGTTIGFGSVRLDYAYLFENKGPGATNRFSLTYDFAPWEIRDTSAAASLARTSAEASAVAASADRSASGRWVAVLDFANATGDANLSWLEIGLADIVAKELAATGLMVLPRTTLAGTANLTGPEILTLASQTNARLVVRGLFVRNSAGRMVLTARIIDGTTGRTMDFIEAEAYENEIFDLGKSIGQGIAAKAGAWLP